MARHHIVRGMPICLALVLYLAVIPPVIGRADVTPVALPPPSASFDDVDDVTVQTDVTQQALDFLTKLRRHWGESAERLKTLTPGTIERDQEGTLIYLRNFHEHGVLEGYQFQKESLTCGQYVMVQRPLNGLNEFIGYYASLKKALRSKYGEPELDRVVWENDLYQPLPDYWGVAVMIGHLRYHAFWNTVDGTIVLELTGNRYSRLSVESCTTHEEAHT
ncbi:MAG TPA: hypothetical protein VFQ02_06110 [Nitrospira sp.]|nr:hypothetical protein [Nitrospira sp.]